MDNIKKVIEVDVKTVLRNSIVPTLFIIGLSINDYGGNILGTTFWYLLQFIALSKMLQQDFSSDLFEQLLIKARDQQDQEVAKKKMTYGAIVLSLLVVATEHTNVYLSEILGYGNIFDINSARDYFRLDIDDWKTLLVKSQQVYVQFVNGLAFIRFGMYILLLMNHWISLVKQDAEVRRQDKFREKEQAQDCVSNNDNDDDDGQHKK